jgi:hypothetical protein
MGHKNLVSENEYCIGNSDKIEKPKDIVKIEIVIKI